jgi:predicted transposase YbfD/YdcC
VIVICASICGAEKWDDIEVFGKSKEAWLRRFLQLPHGIPSHDTFARVFSLLDPQALNERFSSWVAMVNPKHEGQIINIDGKTVRRSHDRGKGVEAIHMVSAWANESGLTLGQRKVDQKSNEITAIPELLDVLELSGCVVTIDAMGTQRAIAEKIIDGDGDYVLALKGNQSTLHDDIKLFFQDIENDKRIQEACDYNKSVDKDHGRIEVRECWATEDIDWLDSKNNWKGLKSICMVKAGRTVGETHTQEQRYYISSMPADAPALSQAIRGVEMAN